MASQNSNYNLTQANLAMIRAVLCCLDKVEPNFPRVTSEFGLSKGHGPRDFRAAIKPLGLDFDGKQVLVAGSQDDAVAAYGPATPSAKGTPKGKGHAKRKAKADEGSVTNEDKNFWTTNKQEEDDEQQPTSKGAGSKKRKTATPATKKIKLENGMTAEEDEMLK